MQKREVLFLKNVALFQIFLMIFAIFSFAFLISETSNVSAQFPTRTLPDGTVQEKWGSQWINVKLTTPPPVSAGNPGITTQNLPPDSTSRVVTGVGIDNVVPKMTHTFSGYKGTGFTVGDKGFQANGYAETAGGKIYPYNDGQVVDGVVLEGPESVAFKEQIATGAGQTTAVPGEYVGPLGFTGFLGHIAAGIGWAVAVVGAIQLIGGLVGWDQSLTDSLSIAAGAGIMTTSLIQALGPTGSQTIGGEFLFTNQVAGVTGAGLIGIAVAVVIFAVMYKKESAKIYNFQCLPYEAPVGGKDCEECNSDPFRPCSEYRCRALGQSCELVNVGSSDEKCVWVNPNDVIPPTITPWSTPLTENHRYTSDATRPTSRGTKIIRNGATDGCLQAFTPLTFGIATNEPAQCKIDLDHKDTLDEMQFFFGNTNLYLYNHTQQFSLPSPGSLNAELPELKNDGKYDFFVRCRDKNGNENVDEFAIQFCVDPSPDTTPPVIVDTSIPSDSFVKFGAGSVPLQVYVNEPATCKWSSQDKEYGVMENTMTCATSLTQINARELYTCITNLTGIADRQENKFYFRCKDQPTRNESDRNVNINSYKFNLRGSQPLNIIFVGPNGTATGNTQTVPVNLKVVTDDGANEGVSVCSFSASGLANSYVLMFETNAVEHSQRLDLTTGNYNYKFRCVDYGGNAAQASVNFSVIVDTAPPLVTRAYHDSANGALKIVTNEDSSCVYSLNSCNYNFNEGIILLNKPASNKKGHYAEWKPNLVYYIKCKDNFENEPAPNSCNIVASASSIA